MFEKSSVYTYYSSKKIYFARTDTKCMLIEKKDYHDKCVINLFSHNPIIICKNTKMLLFPNKLK